MLLRLGLALMLSLTLAVLLAWGWDRSEPASHPVADASLAPSADVGQAR